MHKTQVEFRSHFFGGGKVHLMGREIRLSAVCEYVGQSARKLRGTSTIEFICLRGVVVAS